MPWVIVPAIAALLALFAILARNGLLQLRDSVHSSWASLDSLLLERHDLLAEFVELCARDIRYEQDTVERVVRADAATFGAAAREDIPALAAAEMLLRASVTSLLSIAENYPALCAQAGFIALRERILCVGAAIIERRELYNSAVNLLNVRSQAFPHRLVARAIGFHAEALFE
ncbi:MAG: LemA family protein [Gammaproteobacteria bacterium]|nr:LemA family protein [Gammaproteobacteria bacterium]